MSELIMLLRGACRMSAVLENCPLSGFTTFKIGGPADILIDAGSADELSSVIRLAGDFGVPFFVMGNGSNLLVSDSGFRGIIVKFGKRWADVEVKGDRIIAKSGALLPVISQTACDNGLTGLEFACGIPGSAGGAVRMNAGAYGGDMAGVISKALVLRDNNAVEIDNGLLGFAYRHSAIAGSRDIVLEAEFSLARGDKAEISSKMAELKRRRAEKQPVNVPSAGSAFKRPKGAYAAQLIEECGLKGMRIGGAAVSAKHAGFIVNEGGASARDVLALAEAVKETVFTRTGYELELEIEVLGGEKL